MAGSLKPENIQEMMSALGQFISKVSEATAELQSAGKDCADNLGDDPAGAKANASLSQKIGKINEQVSEANNIVRKLQEELEDIQRRAQAANDF